MDRFLRTLGALLLGLLALLVLGYMIYAGAGVLEANANKRQARDEIDRSLPGARERLAEQHELLRTAAGAHEARWTWTELVCAWETVEGGLIVTDYVQVCRVQMVDLVPDTTTNAPTCVAHTPAATEGLEIVSSVMRIRPAQARPGKGALGCPDDLTTAEATAPHRILEGRRPDDLGDAPAWHVLRTEVPLTRTSIGCHRWSLIFCDRPGDVALPSG